MAVHEFGLMPAQPVPGQRYDAYEPEEYACIRMIKEAGKKNLSGFIL